MKNLREQNDLRYSDQDLQFATRLQQTLDQPKPLETIHDVVDQSGTVGMGSTDVGDVSWVVPTTGFTVACFVPGTPGHSWQAVACGGNEVSRAGMNLASRVLASSAWDLFQQPDLLKVARAEHDERTAVNKYRMALCPLAQRLHSGRVPNLRL